MKLCIQAVREENDPEDFSIDVLGQILTPENGVIFVNADELKPQPQPEPTKQTQ